MTGLYPDQTLIRQNAIHLRQHLPDVQTMSQMFRNARYTATRIGKIYHYQVPAHIGTGGHDDPYSWDRTINPIGRDKFDERLIFSLRPGHFGGTLSWLAAEGTEEEQTDGIAATEACKLLWQYAETDQPFFLAVGLYRPHTPFVAPKKYFDLYPTDEIRVPEVPAGYLETLPRPAVKSITRKRDQVNLAEDLARQAIQAYYASITYVDSQLGRILDTLEHSGLSDNTIVLFTSDHGYHMGEHGHYQKTTLFENATRVPLIVAGPGTEAIGESTQAPTEMVDFYPTVAELSGLTAPRYISGVSFASVLRETSARPRRSALTQFSNGYSIRTDRYRYTAWGTDASEGAELYDHHSDPEELVNLANNPRHSIHIGEMARLLDDRIAEAEASPPGLKQIELGRRRKTTQLRDDRD